MFNDLFASIRDGFRHRFGPQAQGDDYQMTDHEEREALRRHNDAEARIVGRTMGEPSELRAYGKGRPR